MQQTTGRQLTAKDTTVVHIRIYYVHLLCTFIYYCAFIISKMHNIKGTADAEGMGSTFGEFTLVFD